MAMLQGIKIRLYEPTQTGVDAFNHPVFDEKPVDVENVLVFPTGTDPVVDDTNLSGKRIRYTLLIPREDGHVWHDRTVEFWGHKWRTVGLPEEWISDLLPLGWNKRVEVERYG